MPSIDWSYDALALHLDGADGSTSFPELTGKTVTPVGTAKISTAQSRFGGASAYFSGSNSYLRIAASIGLYLGFGDFMLGFWFYKRSGSSQTYQRLLQLGNNAVGGGLWVLSNAAAGNACAPMVQLHNGTTYATVLGPGATIAQDAWHHLRLMRLGPYWGLDIDGALYAKGSSDWPVTATTGTVGANNTGGEAYYGHVDDIHLTRARTGNSGVLPTAPFELSPPVTLMSGSLRASDSLSAYPVPPRAGGRLAGIVGSRDLYDGGAGRILGTVKKKNTPDNLPLQRRVRLHKSRDGRPLAETWSNAAGFYEFRNIDPAGNYYTASFDHLGNFRGVIADNLTPELM